MGDAPEPRIKASGLVRMVVRKPTNPVEHALLHVNKTPDEFEFDTDLMQKGISLSSFLGFLDGRPVDATAVQDPSARFEGHRFYGMVLWVEASAGADLRFPPEVLSQLAKRRITLHMHGG